VLSQKRSFLQQPKHELQDPGRWGLDSPSFSAGACVKLERASILDGAAPNQLLIHASHTGLACVRVMLGHNRAPDLMREVP
jgi:hypothetical protein